MNKYCSYDLQRFDGIAEMNKLGAKKSAARLGSALKTVKIFWEIRALMREGGSCACRRSTLTVRSVWRKTPAVP